MDFEYGVPINLNLLESCLKITSKFGAPILLKNLFTNLCSLASLVFLYVLLKSPLDPIKLEINFFLYS